jgi:hypothetical protein
MLAADACVRYGTRAVLILVSVAAGVIYVLAAFDCVRYVLAI